MNNDQTKKSGISPLAAGAAGIAAGVLAVTLMDKEKRKQIKKMISKTGKAANDVKDKTKKQMFKKTGNN